MESRQMLDIQREAEVMQMVWLQEHSSLQGLVTEVQSELRSRPGCVISKDL